VKNGDAAAVGFKLEVVMQVRSERGDPSRVECIYDIAVRMPMLCVSYDLSDVGTNATRCTRRGVKETICTELTNGIT
jgi:hypothetical protein